MLSIVLGFALAAPAAWMQLTRMTLPWWAQGLGLIAGATGLALVWTGLTGARPDWIENPERIENPDRIENAEWIENDQRTSDSDPRN
jgi:hypothetical protein